MATNAERDTYPAKKTRQSGGSLFTTLWGWFTAPRFGSAGSGGLEYEPFPRWTAEIPISVKR